MTPNQAIELLTQATRMLKLTIDEHQAVWQALQVLSGLIPKEEEPKEVKKK